ncbi:MAG: 3'-5' exoribonuclease domain-containing protein [bacterium]
MRYFFDTEFVEEPQKIDLISIGIISEDERELYLINKECNTINADLWVKENVLNLMPEYLGNEFEFGLDTSHDNCMTKKQISEKILEFVGDDKHPEFWAYYSDYDWVVFCWLYGRMIDLPKHFPMYCKDLKQLLDGYNMDSESISSIIPQQNIHNALDDARWVKQVYDFIQYYK